MSVGEAEREREHKYLQFFFSLPNMSFGTGAVFRQLQRRVRIAPIGSALSLHAFIPTYSQSLCTYNVCFSLANAPLAPHIHISVACLLVPSTACATSPFPSSAKPQYTQRYLCCFLSSAHTFLSTASVLIHYSTSGQVLLLTDCQISLYGLFIIPHLLHFPETNHTESRKRGETQGIFPDFLDPYHFPCGVKK